MVPRQHFYLLFRRHVHIHSNHSPAFVAFVRIGTRAPNLPERNYIDPCRRRRCCMPPHLSPPPLSTADRYAACRSGLICSVTTAGPFSSTASSSPSCRSSSYLFVTGRADDSFPRWPRYEFRTAAARRRRRRRCCSSSTTTTSSSSSSSSSDYDSRRQLRFAGWGPLASALGLDALRADGAWGAQLLLLEVGVGTGLISAAPTTTRRGWSASTRST